MQYSFEDAVQAIMNKHGEYAPDAYDFARKALDFTTEHMDKSEESPHLSARELYMGACAYALEEYGPLAADVLEFWGISSSQDFGNIVYNLIEVGIFGKQKDDSPEQFNNLPYPADLLSAPYTPWQGSDDEEDDDPS